MATERNTGARALQGAARRRKKTDLGHGSPRSHRMFDLRDSSGEEGGYDARIGHGKNSERRSNSAGFHLERRHGRQHPAVSLQRQSSGRRLLGHLVSWMQN